MKIVNLFQNAVPTLRLTAERFSEGVIGGGRACVVTTEHFLSVFVNERLITEMTCTPAALPELVLGWMFTEGIVSGLADVDELCISSHGDRCQVSLRTDERRAPPRAGKENVSCRQGEPEHMPAARPSSPEREERVPFCIKKETVFSIAERFSADTPIHRMTHGTHSCLLASSERVLCVYEDIGRYNALDKAVGHALLQGHHLETSLLYTSGRVPAHMMKKVIQAGIPVVISNAYPTDQAVLLARQYDICLICEACPDRFTVFSGASRVF